MKPVDAQLQYRKRYELLQRVGREKALSEEDYELQYRKRYELLQPVYLLHIGGEQVGLQYRKRYELLQHNDDVVVSDETAGYNTASGMSCCNSLNELPDYIDKVVTIPQAVGAVATELWFSNHLELKLQYRKRYELLQHYTATTPVVSSFVVTIPQAVGAVATCGKKSYNKNIIVTIPQAVGAVATLDKRVFIHCDTVLQYRKRYELLQLQ